MKQSDKTKFKYNKTYRVNHKFYLVLLLIPLISFVCFIVAAVKTEFNDLFFSLAGLMGSALASIVVAWLIDVSNMQNLKKVHEHTSNSLIYNMVTLANMTFWGFSLIEHEQENKGKEHTWKEWLNLYKIDSINYKDEKDIENFVIKSTKLETLYEISQPLINMYMNIVNNRLTYLEQGYITNKDFVLLAYDITDYSLIKDKFKNGKIESHNEAVTQIIYKLDNIVRFLNEKGFYVNKFKYKCDVSTIVTNEK